MAVYIDELRPATPKTKWRYGQSCHLLPEPDGINLEELHMMALRIGLRREWFQDHPTLPHYDLTAGRRDKAKQYGAVEISAREWARKHIDARMEERCNAELEDCPQ